MTAKQLIEERAKEIRLLMESKPGGMMDALKYGAHLLEWALTKLEEEEAENQ
jgi:hypothetical protein